MHYLRVSGQIEAYNNSNVLHIFRQELFDENAVIFQQLKGMEFLYFRDVRNQDCQIMH